MTIWQNIERATDWAVGLVSPRRRAITDHFEHMRSDETYREAFFAIMRSRGYRAAEGTQYATPFGGTNQTADAEILNDLPTLSARGRELSRDDPIASGLKQTFAYNVIGGGMKPQARTGDAEKDKALEAYWNKRKDHLAPADDMTHGEHQRTVFGCAWETGNIFVHAAQANASEPVWFETIEKDRIYTPIMKTGDANVVDGVVKDSYGRPIAYYVLKSGKSGTTLADFDRVDKAEIIHLRLADRPGQTHGVPACHAILQDLHDLDLLILASLKRVQIAACLTVFLKTQKKLDDLLPLTANQYGFKLDQALEPGMIFKLLPNEEVETVAPNFPSSEFDPFIILLCRRIGAALGVSWQIVLKDFSQSTYSSARTDLLEARQGYVIFQKWFVDKLLNWEWRQVMEDGLLRGELPGVVLEDLDKVHWIPPGWQWIDPQTEAAATEIELRLGITTLQEVCASRGKDWEETLYQRLREQKAEEDMRAELGLKDGEYMRLLLDAYGVGVRAGLVTPQEDDEKAMRAQIGLPQVNALVSAAWAKDKGVRKPVTLADTSPKPAPVIAGNFPPKDAEQEEKEAKDGGRK